MRTLQVSSVVAFVVGLALLAYGAWLPVQREPAAAEPLTFDLRATPTPVRPAGSAITGTPAATPTATPTPYDGAVVALRIPTLDVSAAIETIGLLPDNQLAVPEDPHNVGWYEIYDKPGFRGNSVFAGHLNWFPRVKGPFNRLAELRPDGGDTILVEMDDGRVYEYVVVRVTRYDARTIPMGEIIWPPERPAGEEWITLITCGGEFVPLHPDGSGEYLQRDVVVAKRI